MKLEKFLKFIDDDWFEVSVYKPNKKELRYRAMWKKNSIPKNFVDCEIFRTYHATCGDSPAIGFCIVG